MKPRSGVSTHKGKSVYLAPAITLFIFMRLSLHSRDKQLSFVGGIFIY